MGRPVDQAAVPREGGEGNRRRRDRHRRGERGDRPERNETPAAGAEIDDTATPAALQTSAPLADALRGEPLEAQPPMIPSPPAMPTPEVSLAPEVVPAPAARPVEPARVTAPPRPIEALPTVSMTLPADSGLELVETRSKTASLPEPDPTPPPGPRRVRPPRVVIPEEPLQIVETQKGGQPPAG
jgi:hypothetical protein